MAISALSYVLVSPFSIIYVGQPKEYFFTTVLVFFPLTNLPISGKENGKGASSNFRSTVQ